jgi:hypothetical protein
MIPAIFISTALLLVILSGPVALISALLIGIAWAAAFTGIILAIATVFAVLFVWTADAKPERVR